MWDVSHLLLFPFSASFFSRLFPPSYRKTLPPVTLTRTPSICQFLCLPFCSHPSFLSLPPSRAGLLCGGSLVPLGGHYWSPEECFKPQAEAMHSGVASPSTPDLEKISAAQSGTAKKLKCPQLKRSCLASVCISSSTWFPHASLF